jgi:glycerophosphoryl diester phosphodiesterase
MKIYAHRGASKDFPEHTLRAYNGAIAQGADGFECDVRLSKDNVALLWHDADLKRCAGVSGRIADLKYAQIRREYPEVLTLEELLALAKENKKELAIETKHPVPSGNEIEKIVLDLLSQEKNLPTISIMSFSWLAIEQTKRMAPHQNTVALLHPGHSRLMRRFSSAKNLGPSIQMLREDSTYMSESRDLFVWTVDKDEDMQFCERNKVKVLITNTPSRAREVLGYH